MTMKTLDDQERLDLRHLLRAIEQRGFSGLVALLLSLCTCYGTLAALAALSALGLTLTLNPAVWAGAIVLFAGLSAVFVGLGMRRHGSAAPIVPALAGTLLLGHVMFIRFDRALELVAFALLAAGVLWDLRRRSAMKIRDGGGLDRG